MANAPYPIAVELLPLAVTPPIAIDLLPMAVAPYPIAIELRPLARIKKISGPRLHASWVNVPHVTQHDEADITELEESRKKLKAEAEKAGVKLTPLAFVLRACVKALKEFPNVNSSLDPSGQNLVLKKYIHLGFAADTPNGLVVPVIRDADKKDVYEIAKDLAVLSDQDEGRVRRILAWAERLGMTEREVLLIALGRDTDPARKDALEMGGREADEAGTAA